MRRLTPSPLSPPGHPHSLLSLSRTKESAHRLAGPEVAVGQPALRCQALRVLAQRDNPGRCLPASVGRRRWTSAIGCR